MMKQFVVLGAGLFVLSACANFDAAHLVFGQQQSVGLDISATAETGGTLSLGYKDKNVAIVPVAVKQDDGTYKLVGGTNNESEEADRNDTYATLGQFELKTGGNGTASVGLGKFFATGIAAQKLSEGFKEKLKK